MLTIRVELSSLALLYNISAIKELLVKEKKELSPRVLRERVEALEGERQLTGFLNRSAFEQKFETLVTEEPYERVVHVRICGEGAA